MPNIQPAAPSLKSAIRRIRIDEAERSGVMSELRGAEIARLEMLAEALEPVFAQIPDHIDIFDAGVMSGQQPRLYIDMIGFVEMGGDKRAYKFVQNTRHGRVVVASSERIDTMVDAITGYIGRRLVEREQALASDRTIEDAARTMLARESNAAGDPAGGQIARQAAAAFPAKAEANMVRAVAAGAPEPPRKRVWSVLVEGIVFLAELLGFIVLLVALFGALYFGWTFAEAWWVAYFNKTS